MKINLHPIEVMSLYLHLKEYIQDNSRMEESDDIIVKGQYLTMKNVMEKLKSYI